MTKVREEEVIEEWLELEREMKEERDITAIGEARQKMARLLAHKPDAASVFWRYSFDWYRGKLTEDRFRKLHSVWPSEPNFIDMARMVDADYGPVQENADVDRIREMTGQEEDIGPFFIIKRSLRDDYIVFDGNHRATAVAVDILNDKYVPQTAYVGYRVKESIFSRFKWKLARAWSRLVNF